MGAIARFLSLEQNLASACATQVVDIGFSENTQRKEVYVNEPSQLIAAQLGFLSKRLLAKRWKDGRRAFFSNLKLQIHTQLCFIR